MLEEYPNEGVKVTRDVVHGKLFYVFLRYKDEWPVNDGYYTTDCIITRIVKASTGEEVESVRGRAYFEYVYEKGMHISGEEIYFCHSIAELTKYNHSTSTLKLNTGLRFVGPMERLLAKLERLESILKTTTDKRKTLRNELGGNDDASN